MSINDTGKKDQGRDDGIFQASNSITTIDIALISFMIGAIIIPAILVWLYQYCFSS